MGRIIEIFVFKHQEIHSLLTFFGRRKVLYVSPMNLEAF